MKNIIILCAVLVGLLNSAGCKMAEPINDEAYSAYGGVIQRSDTTVERVNSVLENTDK